MAAWQLDLSDPVALTREMVAIPSPSGEERALADALEVGLRALPALRVERDGDAVVARTSLGRETRVVLAGHIDTVPPPREAPDVASADAGRPRIVGRGAADMKSGDAVFAHLVARAAEVEPRFDVTAVFYDHEEVAGRFNGLARLADHHPEWVRGDLAILGEPTGGAVGAGCNGSLRVIARARGRAAHSARPWRGDNAIHRLAPALARIAAFEAPSVSVDGLDYREALSAVRISGGLANNVIPDRAELTVNYRFAPSRTPEQARAFVRSLFEGTGAELTLDDLSAPAAPALSDPRVAHFCAHVGAPVRAKVGWTDVARFSALGIPALNFGPGDPLLAHTDQESVGVEAIERANAALRSWLWPTE